MVSQVIHIQEAEGEDLEEDGDEDELLPLLCSREKDGVSEVKHGLRQCEKESVFLSRSCSTTFWDKLDEISVGEGATFRVLCNTYLNKALFRCINEFVSKIIQLIHFLLWIKFL